MRGWAGWVCALFCAGVQAAPSAWFMRQDALTRFHQAVLEGRVDALLPAWVEAWQAGKTDWQQQLIAAWPLLLQQECGKTLAPAITMANPVWTLELDRIREPLMQRYRVRLHGVSRQRLTQLQLIRQDGAVLLDQQSKATPIQWTANGEFDLATPDEPLPWRAGLYRLVWKAPGGSPQQQWLILPPALPEGVLRNTGEEGWQIVPAPPLPPSCPLPELRMAIYDLGRKDWLPVWHEAHERVLPQSFPPLTLPRGRYWRTVSWVERSQQGSIRLERQVRLSALWLP